jgi:hypothetical protein
MVGMGGGVLLLVGLHRLQGYTWCKNFKRKKEKVLTLL